MRKRNTAVMLHIQIKIRNVRMKFFWRKKAEEYRKPAVYGDAAPAKVVQNVKLYTEKSRQDSWVPSI